MREPSLDPSNVPNLSYSCIYCGSKMRCLYLLSITARCLKKDCYTLVWWTLHGSFLSIRCQSTRISRQRMNAIHTCTFTYSEPSLLQFWRPFQVSEYIFRFYKLQWNQMCLKLKKIKATTQMSKMGGEVFPLFMQQWWAVKVRKPPPLLKKLWFKQSKQKKFLLIFTYQHIYV